MVVGGLDLEEVPVCSLKMILLQGRKKHYMYSSLALVHLSAVLVLVRCTNLDCCLKSRTYQKTPCDFW